MHGLSKVDIKAISERIRAYTTYILTAQKAAWATNVGSIARALDAQAEFLNTLEAYISAPKTSVKLTF